MNDKELLELAAKAAGIELRSGECGDRLFTRTGVSTWQEWNPLADEGDALRLAVRLGMCLDLRHGQSWAAYMDSPDSGLGDYMGAAEFHHKDANAATRRAIVRAAAEIGKDMK